MAKTKYFVKKGPKMADFLCIFCWNFIFLVGKIRDSYSNIFEFQDTLVSSGNIRKVAKPQKGGGSVRKVTTHIPQKRVCDA